MIFGVEPSTTVPFLDFINLGVIVAVLIAILTKKLVPGWTYDEVKARAEKAETQNELLREKMQNEILPQLFSTTTVLAKVTEQQRH